MPDNVHHLHTDPEDHWADRSAGANKTSAHWKWEGYPLGGAAVIGLMIIAKALDDGRSLVEAVLEGVLVTVLFVPFFVLCGIRVEPKPRWWTAAQAIAVALWFGPLPAVAGWMLDYWDSLGNALAAGMAWPLLVAAVMIFGDREEWCGWAMLVCLLAAAGAWITGLASLGVACVFGVGGAFFFGSIAAFGGSER